MNPKTTKIAKKRYINLRRGAYETIEQHECKELQRTMHPTGASQMQSNIEVRRCRVSVLNIYIYIYIYIYPPHLVQR